MDSDKLIYWMTLGVLAVATVSGLGTEHRGWSDRLANRSIATMAEASAIATNYAGIAGIVFGSGEKDSEGRTPPIIDVQDEIQNDVPPQLACAERILVKRQAQLARLQALKVQVRMVERMPRTIVWPSPNIVIEVPQPPEVPVY